MPAPLEDWGITMQAATASKQQARTPLNQHLPARQGNHVCGGGVFKSSRNVADNIAVFGALHTPAGYRLVRLVSASEVQARGERPSVSWVATGWRRNELAVEPERWEKTRDESAKQGGTRLATPSPPNMPSPPLPFHARPQKPRPKAASYGRQAMVGKL